LKYKWPGNVRELEHEIQSLISQSNTGDIINFDLLKPQIKSHFSRSEKDSLETIAQQKTQILALLEKYRWNKSQVAKELNISRTALYKKIKKLNIQ